VREAEAILDIEAASNKDPVERFGVSRLGRGNLNHAQTSLAFMRRERRLRQTVWSARRLARKLARVAVGSGPAVEPQLREAPVMGEGSWVGLDVHARSVVAGVIDGGSGEVRSERVPAGPDETVAWLRTLPAPVRVVYEAGPTGYRLARACAEAGIGCVVAAPSKIRPAADRVKTDRRDAERLARLLRLGEITPVRVPDADEEAARDLVRAREDAMAGPMTSTVMPPSSRCS
jgi:hypothetical protein